MLFKNYAFNFCTQLLFVGLFMFPIGISAQQLTLNYENPDSLHVCDSSKFEIILSADGSGAINNLSVEVWFPKGVNYSIGSVADAVESDVSDLQKPVFNVQNLAPGEEHRFTVWAFGDCSLVAAINAGKLFSNTITANYDGGTERLITQPYLVETGLLVITEITPEVAGGQFGDEIIRRISVRNTRLGKIRSFNFSDRHKIGFSITTDGDNPMETPLLYTAEFNERHFRNIGDGDEFFEAGEELIIEEKLLITDCGDGQTQNISIITVSWGCQGEICQSATRAAIINFEEYTKAPILEFGTEINVPGDFCVDRTYFESLTVQNTGNDATSGLQLTLMAAFSFTKGIDLNSIEVKTTSGTDVSFQVVTEAAQNFADCPDLTGLSQGVVLDVGDLQPGDALVITWDAKYCSIGCGSAIPPLHYLYTFNKNCPVGQQDTGGGRETFLDGGKILNDSISYYIGRVLRDGNSYDFRYDLMSSILVDSMGTIELELEIPCGLSWTSGPMVLDGKAPIDFQITPGTTNSSTVLLTYELPFSNDSVFGNFNLDYACIAACIDAPTVITFPNILSSCTSIDTLTSSSNAFIRGEVEVSAQSTFFPANSPASCGFSDCEIFKLDFSCANVGQGGPPTQIISYLDFDTDFFRKNLGLEDNDDNRIADSQNRASPLAVRTDRFIPGDTSITKIAGEVIVDVPGERTGQGKFRIFFNAHSMDVGLDGGTVPSINPISEITSDPDLFQRNTGIRDIESFVTVIDKSDNRRYRAKVSSPMMIFEEEYGSIEVVNTRPKDIADQWVFKGYEYTVDFRRLSNTSGSDFPPAFHLEEGDSVYFEAKHRMMYNIGSKVFNLRCFSNTSLFTDIGDPGEDFTCGTILNRFQLSGYSYNRVLGNFTSEPCGEFSETVGSGFNVSLGMTNFFPFEFRNLATVVDWDIILGRGFTLKETRIVNAGHDGLPARHRDVLLTADVQGDEFKYDLSPFQDPPYDEGFYINLFHLFESEPLACSFDDRTPVGLHSRVEFNHDFPDLPDFFDDINESSLGIQPLIPDLVSTSLNPISNSTNSTATWDFDIKNNARHPSQNTWVIFQSASNLIFDFKLTDINTGQLVPSTNDVFQIGTIADLTTENYNLTANFNLCGSDTLLVIYGWNCNQIGSPDEFACSRDTFKLILNSPLGELEMDIESPTDPVQLCDEVPFHIVEIFNADLGTAFDLKLKALLPPGITVVPGSSEIAYTTAAGSFVQIADPDDLGAGNYVWDISSVQSTIGNDGLPGVQNDPRNSLSLRFLGFTECGLIASAPIIFNISGMQSCGEPINTLSKPSDEINVVGVTAEYETQIAPVGPTQAECGSDYELEIDIRVLGTTRVGDSIFITLPEGIDYVAGSYSPERNATTEQPIIQKRGNFDVLKWKMETGLPDNSNIIFKIKTVGFGDLGCTDVAIQVQTIQSAEALCITTGELCPVLVQTGDALVVIEILSPDFSFDQFYATPASGGVDYVLDIGNTGQNTGSQIIVDFYLDTDGNGFFSSGDTFLESQTLNGGLVNGDVIRLAGNLNVPDDQICTILAVIDADKNCSCSTEQAIIRAQQTVQQTVEVCSNDVVQIGINPVSGNIYSWNNPENISCTGCPQADFSFQNVSLDTVAFNYVLTDNNGSCPIRNLIKVIVYPELRLFKEDTTICEGISVFLQTTIADTYNWSGPGITDPTSRNQTVTPSQSAVYTVEIKNDFGCAETETVNIEVIPGPIADAGQDTTLCESATGYQLNALTDPNYDYIWLPVHLLSDIFSGNPVISPPQTSDFILQVTDRRTNCSMRDTVFVAFSEAPELAVSGDVTICLGDSVQLIVSGAEEYIWSPFASLSCGDCPFTYAQPSTPTTYTVTGINGRKCEAEATITVDIEGEVTFIENDTTLCGGDTLFVGGFPVTRDSMLPETIRTFDECDTVISHDIKFIPSMTETDELLCLGDSILILDGLLVFEPGTYIDTIQSGRCPTTRFVNVMEADMPNVAPQFDTLIIEIGDTVELSLPDGFDIYQWSPNTALSCTDCQVTKAYPTETTDYIGEFFNAEGCGVTFRFRVIVAQECSRDNVLFPNIFSPNGDGINDVFKPMTDNFIEEVISMKVWNRWGEKVYEGSGENAGWNGTYKGEEANSDVFIYRIVIGCSGVAQEPKKGDVTLYR